MSGRETLDLLDAMVSHIEDLSLTAYRSTHNPIFGMAERQLDEGCDAEEVRAHLLAKMATARREMRQLERELAWIERKLQVAA